VAVGCGAVTTVSGTAAPGRLSLRSLPGLPLGPALRGPAVDPRRLTPGVVHLGIGAFHRAHQAVYTEDAAAATGSDEWGIVGVTQRSVAVRDQLVPQDGLYTVVERGTHGAARRVIASVREVLHAVQDGAAVLEWISSPKVRLVSLTVTEKGYRRRSDGRLDLDDPLVAADLAGGSPRTPIGQLVRGMQRRLARHAEPLTVLCCDNLTSNGQVVAGLVGDFIAALPARESGDLSTWVDAAVRFPGSMVDRIVPATTEADLAEVAAVLGVEDRGAVVAEPFSQWVIEDRFAADRPAWERAGAVLTDDVEPWETAKLRLLNGTHSLLAYLGALHGHRTIAETLSDDEIGATAEAFMRQDVLPTLAGHPGMDLDAYCGTVLDRFRNEALRHRTAQVAMDGSQKLPLRLLGTVRDRLAAGVVPPLATRAVAAWMVYVARSCEPGSPLVLDDPRADRLGEIASRSTSAAMLVDGLLTVRETFGDDLPYHAGFRDLLVHEVGELRAQCGGR
jgi:fructuronate reductase